MISKNIYIFNNLILRTLLFIFFLIFTTSSFSKNSDQLINEIEYYLNSIDTLQAKFIQLDENGNYKSGILMIDKPGRIRFEYNKPTSILIVSDGQYVIFYDKELEQINRMHINKIPIKFLVDKNFSFKENEIVIKNIQLEGNVITLTIKDNKNLLQGDLTILFERNPLILKQWIIEDSQGYKTKISLDEINTNVIFDEKKFKFNYTEKIKEINKTFLPD